MPTPTRQFTLLPETTNQVIDPYVTADNSASKALGFADAGALGGGVSQVADLVDPTALRLTPLLLTGDTGAFNLYERRPSPDNKDYRFICLATFTITAGAVVFDASYFYTTITLVNDYTGSSGAIRVVGPAGQQSIELDARSAPAILTMAKQGAGTARFFYEFISLPE